MKQRSKLIEFTGVPLCEGAAPIGTRMGPDALRAVGIIETLRAMDFDVSDRGNLEIDTSAIPSAPSSVAKNLGEIAGWIDRIGEDARHWHQDAVQIFAGGDHAMSAGTVPALSKQAADRDQPFFVLWLDAHPDFHTVTTTQTGNLHGTPVAYFIGEPGFEDAFPPLVQAVQQTHCMMLGLRSVDEAERQRLKDRDFDLCDMRRVDEEGIVKPLTQFLDRVKAVDGHLHVSFDLDFLDPSLAPGCGTPVRGGATEREAHLVMELVHESGCLRSLDLVELNPMFDHAGQSARVMTDLVESLFGRRILEP